MTLADFVNLADGLSALQSFRAKWPDFFPGKIYDLAEHEARESQDNPDWKGVDASSLFDLLAKGLPLPHEIRPHRLQIYRDWLRRLWDGVVSPDNPHVVLLLLGIEPHDISIRPEYRAALAAQQIANWQTGEVEYHPANNFQRAFYTLFKESWRARICRSCGKYFVADKPPQMYCSTRCYGESKRKRDLTRWKLVGNVRRRERRRKSQRKRRTKR